MRARTRTVARSPELEEPRRSRLGDLYLVHADGAVRLAYLLTGDRALADDLVQDAFVYLAGRLSHLRNPDSFDAYLRRTVVNLANMHFRRRKVERAYLENKVREPGPGRRDPDVAMLQTLRAALLRLPHRQRAAVVLRYYLDIPDAETGDILRCRRGTVRSLVSRGMETLRAELRGEEDGPDGG
ncbi:MAG: RNA polymerase sigma factor [Actinomycetota bacterium]